jgi:hypothetical protein
VIAAIIADVSRTIRTATRGRRSLRSRRQYEDPERAFGIRGLRTMP